MDFWRKLRTWCSPPAAPFLFAVPLSLVFVTWPTVPLYAVADISLSGVLNEAHLKGLQWGKDFVGTYGPLGFLIFPCFSPHNAGGRMLVDAMVCYTVATGLCLIAWRLPLVWRFLLLAIFIFLLPNVDPRTDLVLNLALLFWGLLCLASSGPRLRAYVAVFAVLAAFASLAKLSFLIWSGVSISVLAADLFLRGNLRLGIAMAAGCVASFLLGWIVAGQNVFHLGSFFLNGMAVLEGYNQTVGMQGLEILRQCGFIVFALCVATILLRALSSYSISEPYYWWRRCLLLLWLSGFLFVSWKHGFLRADPWHMLFFFGFAPVMVLTLELVAAGAAGVSPAVEGGRPAPRKTRPKSTWPARAVVNLLRRVGSPALQQAGSPPLQDIPAAQYLAKGLAVAAVAVTVLSLQWFLFPTGLNALTQPFRSFCYNLDCLCNPAAYQTRMNDVLTSLARDQQLPLLGKLIGRSSLDVFGYHQSYATLNGLNYSSRPVCQSAVAATARLMRLNEQFYLSTSAPEYMLFDLFPNDHKLAPLEDAFLLRHLLINFEPIGVEYPFLLLRARSSIPARLTLLREGIVSAGAPIDLRPYGDADLWLEIQLKPTWLGRIRQFLYKPSSVRLAASSATSGKRLAKHLAPAATLSAGFLASPLLLNNQDVMNLYANQNIIRPASYSVELTAGEEYCWDEDIHFRLYKIQNRLGNADFQSAVSQNCILQTAAKPEALSE